jgi:hypothetical protein
VTILVLFFIIYFFFIIVYKYCDHKVQVILNMLLCNRIITIKKANICYSKNSNCQRRCLIQHKSRKIGGFFKVNCDVMDGDLRRHKTLEEALWWIYVILKRIGKVSTRFYKYSFLMLIGWGRYEWKKCWRKMSLSKIADDPI